jgi:hypothetical protein
MRDNACEQIPDVAALHPSYDLYDLSNGERGEWCKA